MKIVTVVQAPPARGRPRAVLDSIEDTMRWQDFHMYRLQVCVDGQWYVPAWLLGGD